MRWKPLIALGAAQFLRVLDTSVINVSISQLVGDFDTTVTAVQALITVYTLVVAASRPPPPTPNDHDDRQVGFRFHPSAGGPSSVVVDTLVRERTQG